MGVGDHGATTESALAFLSLLDFWAAENRIGGGLQGGSGIRAIGCGLGVIDSAMVIKSVEVCRCI